MTVRRAVYVDATEQSVRLLGELSVPDGMRIHQGDPDRETLHDLLRGAEIVLNGHTYMGSDEFDAAPDLRRIVFLGTGASSYIDLTTARARGISVSTIGGYGDQAVAQHAIALALTAIRQIAAMDRDIRSGIWLPRLGREFGEMTFGVMGMGGIGRATAELALGLGFDVIGWNRSPLSSAPCRMVGFDELLSKSDVLSLHLALVPNTARLLDARALSRMRKTAILVNTARAGLVDQGALMAALDRGALAHAALDVFEQEPLPLADPLSVRSDVTLSAHAGFKTDAAMRRLLVVALKQME